MRSGLRTAVVVTAALSAAVTLYVSTTLPNRTIHLDGTPPDNYVAGAYHVHTSRSDGTGSVDDVAQAAGEAGLRFVILTDHGDGTRTPEPPAYRHDVLMIDAVEINTAQGHVVALGLETGSPYPLAGEARDVIEDIHRLGGVAVVAHPDSPGTGLQWSGRGVAFDGIEWLNADSEWRDETARRLLTVAAHSLFRPAESIASLFGRPSRSMQMWDAAARQRAVFGLAAVDAHARIGWADDQKPRNRTVLRRPSYLSMFRTVSQVAVLDTPLSGNAREDARRVIDALIGGRSFSLVRALAEPATLRFEARRGTEIISMGARVAPNQESIAMEASIPEARGARLTLRRNGQPVTSTQGRLSVEGLTEPGVYRVEAELPGFTLPWIVSNPITIQPAITPPASTVNESVVPGSIVSMPEAPEDWVVERDPSSSASRFGDDGGVRFEFKLADGESRGQYAALVSARASEVGASGISFIGRASKPLRISVQVRLPGGREGQRWRRSVYLDTTPRPVRLRLQDFEPADRPTSRRPIAAPIQSLLFVVDTVNSKPGESGTIWISDMALSVDRTEAR